MEGTPLDLADGLRLAGLGVGELWTRYAAIGGNGDEAALRRHLSSSACPDEHEHNIIAEALNDVFIDQDRDHPVGYKHLHHPGDES